MPEELRSSPPPSPTSFSLTSPLRTFLSYTTSQLISAVKDLLSACLLLAGWLHFSRGKQNERHNHFLNIKDKHPAIFLMVENVSSILAFIDGFGEREDRQVVVMGW